METVYKLFFFIKTYSNWTFLELYNLPVALRKWFTDQIIDLKKRENEAINKSS